ncbi:Wzz/FepE/Etk N-terminal domain-containing protein [Marinoscillum sp.]|uniref:Wzz/FepE/Etk N-terminal domain-containing protein n=1 Tax=Marinoscillum sp. TaxID=2024838 RepID=UPI003BA869BA
MRKSRESDFSEDEIDLTKLFRVLWRRRGFIIKVVLGFLVIGTLVAFTAKIEFQSSSKLLSENSSNSKNALGGLGGLAGLAGINLEFGIANTGSLSPELYPEIVKSSPFITEVISSPLQFESSDSVLSAYEYFQFYDKPPFLKSIFWKIVLFPKEVIDLFGEESTEGGDPLNSQVIQWNSVTAALMTEVENRIEISIDKKTGIISVQSKMPDPIAAAELNDIVVRELTKYISDYRTRKAKANLTFIQERFDEAQDIYIDKQKNLASFLDRNKNITSALVEMEYTNLQNELGVSLDVLKSISTQLEQAKIKVKEDTPVFSVLEPTRVPLSKSEPKRMSILIIFGFLGFFIGSSYVLLRKTYFSS